MTRFHHPTQAHTAARRRVPATTETLAEALRAQAPSAASALARGACARAREKARWSSITDVDIGGTFMDRR